MKVYFTTGYENPKKSLSNIRIIQKAITENGHTFVKRPLKSEHGSNTYKVKEEEITDIFDFQDKSIEKIYSEATKRIRGADIVIAEASYFLSPGVGFELGYALHEKKPVLILVSEKSNVIMSEVIEGNPSRYLSYGKYSSNSALETKVKNFLKDSKEKLDTKFILIISPEIDQYLEWAADFKRMHKAQIVRNAVEKEMENDRDYKRFLDEQNK
ncbi:nucleoside 2-deoxyribosyltransferase [Patescibacteria group bacterium]